MKVSVIIVNYKVKFFLAQCLHSVLKAMDGIDGEVIVVDNNSQDDSIDYVRGLYPQVTFIENKENLGFACANNIAIRQSKGEYVVLLNPDTVVNEHLLTDCISLLDSNPNIGATGVRMLNEDGTFAPESRRGVPTPFTAFCKMVGLTKLFPKSRLFGRYYMKYFDEYATTPIAYGDNDTFSVNINFGDYGKTYDGSSYRMLKTGKQNYYVPTRIMHYKGESTKKDTFRYVYVFYEAMYIFFKKHYANYNWILSIPIRSAIYIKGATEFVLRKLRSLFVVKGQTDHDFLLSSRFLLKGSNRTIEAMVEICDHYRLTYDIIENETVKYDFVVFDVSEYSYEQILEELERKSKSKETIIRLATYSPQMECILLSFCCLKKP